MQQSIVGLENIYPYTFSDCSLDDYIKGFRESRSMCLLNKPNEVSRNSRFFVRCILTWIINFFFFWGGDI